MYIKLLHLPLPPQQKKKKKEGFLNGECISASSRLLPHNEAQIVNHDFPKLILVLFSLRSTVVNASSIYFIPKMKKKKFPFFS